MPEIKLVYQQIKDYIENEAKSKKPGEFLSSEVQYSTLFQVSRPTVRKAVDELVEAGLIKRVPGKGLAVSDPFELNKTGNLLFLLPYVQDDGFTYNIIMGCINAANNSGFSYKILNSIDPNEKVSYIKDRDLSDFSGVILTAYENKTDYEVLDMLDKKHIPYVLVDNPVEDRSCPYVVTDDFKGGYLSGQYIVGKGHKKILYLSIEGSIHTVKHRELGFKKALEDSGIVLPEEYFLHLKNDHEIVDVLPGISVEYTAICSYSDIPVIMAYNLLTDRGVGIPDNVSLIGYGNFKASELLKVPLTTVAMPVYDMGYKATDMLIQHITRSVGMESITLDVLLIERSTIKNIE